jgi:PKD domain
VRRTLIVAVALLTTATPAYARQLSGVVPDIPTGAHYHPPLVAHAADLPYNGGPVMHSNRAHLIFWQPAHSGLTYDPGYEALIERFLSDVAADSRKPTNVYGLSGQYSDAGGPAAYDSSYGGAVVATDPLPQSDCSEPPMGPPGWTVCLTDTQLQTEIDHVVAADHLPSTGRDIYILTLPNGLGTCSDTSSMSCALGGPPDGYCGYHQQTVGGVLYAVVPYNAISGHCQSDNSRPNGSTADPTISTISHEHNETVTDPLGNAWVDASSNEDGDLCVANFGPNLGGSGNGVWDEVIHGDHYYLQEEWSNADGSCQPRARADSVSFTHARRVVKARSSSFAARTSAPQARIVTYEWFFGDGHHALGRRVSHRFRRAGHYRVVLRTTDSWGNWAFDERTVTVVKR